MKVAFLPIFLLLVASMFCATSTIAAAVNEPEADFIPFRCDISQCNVECVHTTGRFGRCLDGQCQCY